MKYLSKFHNLHFPYSPHPQLLLIRFSSLLSPKTPPSLTVFSLLYIPIN